jgi:hypothetical protein
MKYIANAHRCNEKCTNVYSTKTAKKCSVEIEHGKWETRNVIEYRMHRNLLLNRASLTLVGYVLKQHSAGGGLGAPLSYAGRPGICSPK